MSFVYVVRINHVFLWQMQYLMMLEKALCCSARFVLWQAQYLVKFGMIAAARNVVFSSKKCAVGDNLKKVTSVGRRVAE